MKRLLGLLVGIVLLVSCIQGLVKETLYQYETANKNSTVTEVVPAPLKSIDLIGADGNRTFGWYYEYTEKRAPVVIFFHGNGSNIQGNYDSGFIEKLKNLKVNFAIFDYPKYGLSTGEPNQESVVASSQGVYNFMKQKFPQSEFIIWGRSLGCAPATIIAKNNQSGISKLILTTPWNSFWKMVQFKANLSEEASKKAAVGNEYETEVHAKEITLPVLIHHGTLDKVVPWEMGKSLSESFAGNDVTFVSLEGYDHGNLLIEQSWDDISKFIRY